MGPFEQGRDLGQLSSRTTHVLYDLLHRGGKFLTGLMRHQYRSDQLLKRILWFRIRHIHTTALQQSIGLFQNWVVRRRLHQDGSSSPQPLDRFRFPSLPKNDLPKRHHRLRTEVVVIRSVTGALDREDSTIELLRPRKISAGLFEAGEVVERCRVGGMFFRSQHSLLDQ